MNVRLAPARVAGHDGRRPRLACCDKGVFAHHPNAWGAFINSALRSGLIEPTGKYRAMRDRRSHGRETRVYRRGV